MGETASTSPEALVSQDTGAQSAALPLAVDLDGTLIHSDTLIETWLVALRKAPLTALAAPFYLLRGKAHLKARLTEAVSIDVASLPYNEELLDYLREEKSQGRHLALATASHMTVARPIAEHVGLFDEVIATDDTTNLRGPAKAEHLSTRYADTGFAYAGNDRHDLVVWRAAKAAIPVDTPSRVLNAIETPVEKSFQRETSPWRELIRGMRVYQWVKNVLVFLPLVTANALGDVNAVLAAILAFFLFGIVASGVYLMNDLSDLQADRAHAEKRNRPFASGSLPLTWGIVAGPGLLLLGLIGAYLLKPSLGHVILAYAVVTTAYSLYLKTQPLVDVFVLAMLYTLRVVAGGVATGYEASIWLLSFSSFFFLSLAFVKRYVEIIDQPEGTQLKRRGYRFSEDVPLFVMGIASAFSAAIVLALYVESSVASVVYSRPIFIWSFVPLCLFWQCRIWLAAVRGHVTHDPILYAARDWVSAGVFGMAVLMYLIAR